MSPPSRACSRRCAPTRSARPTACAGRSSRARWPSAQRVARLRRAGRPVGRADLRRHAVADRLALSKVRAALGPRDPLVLTGAAPIGLEVLEFFDACGMTVLEGYGMTETCAAATLNAPGEQRLGSVGRPLPGTEVTIAGDGEVLMRGPHVFAGYHRDPEATEAALRRRLAALRRPRRARRRRLPAHHRPQEGPDHHLQRQEHLARADRERAA